MIFPLRLVVADDGVRSRAVLLGNAAQSLHPIAAQGFNLGLRDVAVLAELLATAIAAGVAVDDASILRAYAKQRQLDKKTTIKLCDGLARVFSSDMRPLLWLRDLAMLAVDSVPPFKSLLAKQSMGLLGRMPRIG